MTVFHPTWFCPPQVFRGGPVPYLATDRNLVSTYTRQSCLCCAAETLGYFVFRDLAAPIIDGFWSLILFLLFPYFWPRDEILILLLFSLIKLGWMNLFYFGVCDTIACFYSEFYFILFLPSSANCSFIFKNASQNIHSNTYANTYLKRAPPLIIHIDMFKLPRKVNI